MLHFSREVRFLGALAIQDYVYILQILGILN